MSREAVAARLQELCVVERATLEQYVPAFAGRLAEDAVSCFESPDDILIVVAGGSGLYSMVMPSWCAGEHRNTAVSVAVDLNPFCEVPGLSG